MSTHNDTTAAITGLDTEIDCAATFVLMVAACGLAGGLITRGIRSAWKRRAR
ncbi:MAG: hypothetical protein ACRDNT_21650 [Streptosporangiaceae bacterium]